MRAYRVKGLRLRVRSLSLQGEDVGDVSLQLPGTRKYVK